MSAATCWLELEWPAEVEADRLQDALRVLTASGVRPLALDAVGEAGLVRHRLGVPAAGVRSAARALVVSLPDLSVQPVDRAEPTTFDVVVRVSASSRHRPLRSDAVELSSRAIGQALAAAGRDEQLLLRWDLLSPLDPPFHRSDVAHRALQGWGSALVESPFRGNHLLDAQELKALREKQGDVGWRVLGTIAVRSSADRRRPLVAGVLTALRTLVAPGATWHGRSVRRLPCAEPWMPLRGRSSLNLAELLAVSGWPVGETARLPVRSRRSRVLPPAGSLLSSKRVIGQSTAPPERPVSLSIRDGLMHTAITAPTGTGKSTLLMQLALRDIDAGRGLVVVDPKGGLIDAILERLVERRVEDVVVVDPSDATHPVGLNPLRLDGRSPDAVVDQLLEIFRSLFAGFWGPRTQDILHASLLTLVQTPGATLASLPQLLTDDAYRRRVTKTIDDPFGVGSFWASFDSWSSAERSTNIGPTLTRLRPFLMRPQLRRMLGQANPRWSIASVFTERKIILVDLSRDKLGIETTNLLGSLLVSELWQATLRRGSIPTQQRHPVTVIADEFQDYCHFARDFEDALAKSRSFGVGWVLAHQHLGQLSTSIRAAVQANARSKILFQLDHDDAKTLTRHDAVLTATDLTNLPAFEAYARLMADGSVQPWCSIRTLPPGDPVRDAAAVRRASRARYGADVESIDAALTASLHASSGSVDDLGPVRRTDGGRS